MFQLPRCSYRTVIRCVIWTFWAIIGVTVDTGLLSAQTDHCQRVELIYPKGGEQLPPGADEVIEWTGGSDGWTYDLEFSTNNGISWQQIASGLTTTSYTWRVPFTPSDNCLMRVHAIPQSRVDSIVSLVHQQTNPFSDNSITSVEFSPDGKRVGIATRDYTGAIFDATSGQLLHELPHDGAKVWCTRYSPDGRYIITCAGIRVNPYEMWEAKIWDAQSGALHKVLLGHKGEIWSARFSPDSRYVATVSSDGTVRLSNVISGVLEHVFTGHTNWVTGVNFSPDGSRIISFGLDGTPRVWDAATGTLIFALSGHNNRIHAGQFNSAGTQILTAGLDGTARLWNATTGKLESILAHGAPVTSASFSPDGGIVAVGGTDSTTSLWDAATGMIIRRLDGGRGFVQFSDDGKRLLTMVAIRRYGDPPGVALWDVQSGQLLKTHLWPHAVAMCAGDRTLCRAVVGNTYGNGNEHRNCAVFNLNHSGSTDASEKWSITAPFLDYSRSIKIEPAIADCYTDTMDVSMVCNSGNRTVRVLGVKATSGDIDEFNIPYRATYIQPGECYTIPIRFAPKHPGMHKATLTVFTDVAVLRDSITVSGQGFIPEIEIQPTIDFGCTTTSDSGGAPLTFLVRNVSDFPIPLSSVEFIGTAASDFRIDPASLPKTLQPDTSYSVRLTFTPSVAGYASARLLLHTSPSTCPLQATTLIRGYKSGGSVAIDSVNGVIGGTVNLALRLRDTRIPSDSLARPFTAEILYSPDLLSPNSRQFPGSRQGDLRSIKVTGVWNGQSDTLLLLPATLCLGSRAESDLALSSFSWLDLDCPALSQGMELINGHLVIGGLCTQNNLRLIRTGTPTALKSLVVDLTSGTATAVFSCVEDGRIRLRLFDRTGRCVKDIYNELTSAGTHLVTFETSGLPTDVYLCTLDTETQRSTTLIHVP